MIDFQNPRLVEVDHHQLEKSGDRWGMGPVSVEILDRKVSLVAESASILRLRFNFVSHDAVWLGDHWERGYGDLEWRPTEPARKMPWYALGFQGGRGFGFGVKTQPSALAWWTADGNGIDLWLDVRSGGVPVELRGDKITVVDLVGFEGDPDESAFAFARRFCKVLCPNPIVPSEPVWGFNDWYYSYGSSTRDSILRDTDALASLRPNHGSTPFSVIDMGWAEAYPKSQGGPQRAGNAMFGDMGTMADEIRRRGARPGIWVRPLYTLPGDHLPTIQKADSSGCVVLDPSHPDVLKRVSEDIHRCHQWGYELIKHDFTSFDILRRWGFQMSESVTPDGWAFGDRSKTTAQVLLGLYRAIHSAAGDSMVLGCNVVGHLAAGLVQLQRTGDDTSGQEWARTRKMGVNTLAMRMAQEGTFFATDADCVGLTNKVPWEKNAQWLDLLARSGTPLFVSAAPDALGPDQRSALKEAFARASVPQELAEPLDWMSTLTPTRWKTSSGQRDYLW